MIRTAAFALCLALLSVCAVFGQPLRVSVAAPDSIAVRPADFATVVFTVVNEGTQPDTYDVNLTASAGLTALSLPAELTLGAGQAEPVFVTLVVAPTAPAGAGFVQLSVRSRTDPQVAASARIAVTVSAAGLVEIESPAPQRAQPGGIITYAFRVVNRGNLPDLYSFSALSSNGFPTRVSPPRAAVGIGESSLVIVALEVPRATTAPDDVIVLRAVSLNDPSVAAEARVTTEILPLRYEEVPTFLGLELATRSSAILRMTGADVVQPLDMLKTIAVLAESSAELPGDWDLWMVSTLSSSDAQVHSLRLTHLSSSPRRVAVSPRFISLPSFLTIWVGQDDLDFALAFSRDFRTVGARLASITDPVQVSLAAVSPMPKTLLASAVAQWRRDEPLWTWTLGMEGGASRSGSGAVRIDAQLASRSFAASLAGFSLAEDFGDRTGTRLTVYAALPTPLPFSLGLDTSVERNQSGSGQMERLRAFLQFRMDFATLIVTHLGERRTTIGAEDTSRRGTIVEAMATSPLASIRAAHLELRERDLVAGTLLASRRSDVELRIPLERFVLTFGYFRGQRDVQAESGFTASASWSAFAAQVSSVVRSIGDSIEQTHTAALSADMTWPVSGIPTKGQVAGRAFIDLNGDLQYQPNEPGVPDLLLSLDGVRALTDAAGRFRFPPVRPGRFRLSFVDRPAFLDFQRADPIEIDVRVGVATDVDLPLVRLGGVVAVVYHDQDRDGTRGAREAGVGNVVLELSGLAQRRLITDAAGEASLRLAPGDYLLRLDERSLPRRFAPTTATEISFQLQPERIMRIEFGAAEAVRPIRLAPIADFTFSPELPRPGQAVLFDASASLDPDGSIVRYEWDFDADGMMDAVGRVVRHSFSRPGDYAVRLVVSDDDDNQNAVTKIVPVRD